MKQEQQRVGVRLTKGMNSFMTAIAEAKGDSKNTLIKQFFWLWKAQLNRQELVLMLGEERLTELEIQLYAERKGK